MGRARADFEFTLNGKPVRVDAIAPQTTLLDYVRGRGLTGAKEGCAEGECGACAVLFVKDHPAGSRYTPVNSCLVPLPMAAGQEVLTVEALASNGQLCDAQRAMAEGGGSQCGYCTPGFVISMFAEHYRREDRAPDIESLSGNLCRCTGYRPIRDALMSLGAAPDGPHRARLDRPAPKLRPLGYETKWGKFSRPEALEECFDLLAADPHARLVAGNTDLGVATNLNGERFPHLVSVENLAELRAFRDDADAFEIGAGLTLSEIAERWNHAPPVFQEWLKLFASPLIRNRATLGGNLATASPIGDSAPLLLAFGAEVRVASRAGERAIPLASFFRGFRNTVLEHGDLLISVRIPKPLPDVVRYYKIAKRSCDDISTVAAGMSLWRDRQGRILRAHLAFGGVGPTPLLAADSDFEAAARLAVRSVRPISDHRGSAAYRSAVAQSLIGKFRLEVV